MEEFRNKSESFYREIRKVEIYKADGITYIDNFNGTFPPPEPLYSFEVVPESYDRNVKLKTQSGNYFTNIDVSFPLLDISIENREKCAEYFNKKDFAVVLISNTEKMMLGNDREVLKVEVIDGIKDDNSGNDDCTIAISGETIINPKVKKL